MPEPAKRQATHIWVSIGKEEVFRDHVSDTLSFLVGRRRRVYAVVGQGHARARVVGSVRAVAITTIVPVVDLYHAVRVVALGAVGRVVGMEAIGGVDVAIKGVGDRAGNRHMAIAIADVGRVGEDFDGGHRVL